MLKKLPLAAAIAICAAFPTAAYASGIGSAVGGAVSAGGEIMNDAFDAGRDILNGFTARDTEGNGTPDDNDPADTTPGVDADLGAGDTAGDTASGDTVGSDTVSGGNTSSDTASDNTTSSEDTVSGGNDNMANSPNNPSTGVTTLGYTAVAAVLAAMGVMTTAVRRRDD